VRAQRELGELAYAASHDLKEPLRAVTGYLRLLESRYADALDAEGLRFLVSAMEGAERMDGMITGLLAYSRAGSAELRFEDVEPASLVAEAAEDLGGVRVDVGELPTVCADASQLGIVFRELLANAAKFGGENIRVAGEATADGWRFSVEDDGIGIDAAHADRVFQVFGRLHTRSEYDGTGMGLAVCRTIVERHGGEISMEPAPGGGSRFEFTLGEP